MRQCDFVMTSSERSTNGTVKFAFEFYVNTRHVMAAVGRAWPHPRGANVMFCLFKPDDYFDIDWRRQAGAGPVFLIHDVDNLRYLFGEIVAVQARESDAASDLRKDPNA